MIIKYLKNKKTMKRYNDSSSRDAIGIDGKCTDNMDK